jgi:hypothetical protein
MTVVKERPAMDEFLDQAARILASTAPRRQALKLLGSALVAGLFGAAGAAVANAQSVCAANCSSKQLCCPGLAPRGKTATPFCIASERTCCGNVSCGPGQACCFNTCCGINQSCNQNTLRCQASDGPPPGPTAGSSAKPGATQPANTARK